MQSKKHRGAGWVAAGWGVILALACSAERLADSLGGWCIVLGGIAVAYALMRVGEASSTTASRRRPSQSRCA